MHAALGRSRNLRRRSGCRGEVAQGGIEDAEPHERLAAGGAGRQRATGRSSLERSGDNLTTPCRTATVTPPPPSRRSARTIGWPLKISRGWAARGWNPASSVSDLGGLATSSRWAQ